MPVSDSNRRIAKNTLYLYIRMFFSMAVGLYTSRIVLQVLGSSDYGINNVIGGVVGMFGMISGALAVGTQRFLNYAMGENDFPKLKRTFSIALGLHIVVALLIVLLSETVGVWFLNSHMNIPEGRMEAANWLLQFSIITFAMSFIQSPFSACIIAHEKMDIYAYMSIYDVVMKLIVVFLIQYISFDKLILFAGFTFLVNLSSTLIYNYYCRNHFPECRFQLAWDKKLTLEIADYCGWNIFGGSVYVFAGNGVNILLNIFFGTIVNAARGISSSVNGYVMSFVGNFQTAVNPQIVKLYAAEEYDKLYQLIVNNARVVCYLFLFLAIPFFIEVRFVLKVWLGEYPAYTEIFTQIILIQSLNSVLDYPIGMLIHAAGKMRKPTITAILLLSIFPVDYIALRMGASPITVYIITAGLWMIQNVGDLYWAHYYTKIPLSVVLKKVYLNCYIGAAIMFAVPFLISRFMEEGLVRFLVVGFSSVLWSAIITYYWGLTPGMRDFVIEKIESKLHIIVSDK